jgi:hypothetical protein
MTATTAHRAAHIPRLPHIGARLRDDRALGDDAHGSPSRLLRLPVTNPVRGRLADAQTGTPVGPAPMDGC